MSSIIETAERPRRKRWVVLAVAVVLIVVGAVVVLTRTDKPRKAVSGTASERAARGNALEACSHLAQFEAIVKADGPADKAKSQLEQAINRAKTAADENSTWIALLGGAQALNVAIQTNDGPAASVGIRSVHAECARTTK